MPISAVFWRGALYQARNFGGPPHRNLLAASLCPARVAPAHGSGLDAYLLMVDGAVSHADLVHSTCRHAARAYGDLVSRVVVIDSWCRPDCLTRSSWDGQASSRAAAGRQPRAVGRGTIRVSACQATFQSKEVIAGS